MGEPKDRQSDRDSGSRAGSDSVRLPRDGGESLLITALAYLERKDRTDRPQPWSPAAFQVVKEEEINLLREWADQSGLWKEPSDLGEIHRGRREHDIAPNLADDVIFKITRGPGYGLAPTISGLQSGMISDWFAIFPATPSQYLERLLLSNHLYPGLNSLEGFCDLYGRFVIITSQPFVAGRNATQQEISAFMTQRKFTKLCHATWFRSADRLAIFDVGGSNFFAAETGELVPIDVIPIQAKSELLHRLNEAHQRVTHR